MLKRIPKTGNAILNFQLGEDLFMLAQVRRNRLMIGHDVCQDSPAWPAGLNLGEATVPMPRLRSDSA